MAYKPRILAPTEGGTGASNTATSRKILVGDGTNFVSSTETWAVPGTSGNVLTSDGTNWTSAAAAGGGAVSTATVTLTSAQIKALHATPITLVAAPGSGKVVVLLSYFAKFVYGGSNVFVAGAAQNIKIYYSDLATNSQTVFTNSIVVGTATNWKTSAQSAISTTTTNFENLGIVAYNDVATEISGNAANNNTIDFIICYYTGNA